MNVLDDWGCFRGHSWMVDAQNLAAGVEARRGIAEHLLFGRRLIGFARLQAEFHAGLRYKDMRRGDG
jgi:hypothetical protein